MIAVFFFDPDTGYTQFTFNDNPLLKVPADRLPYRAVGLISEERGRPIPSCTGTPIAPNVILTNAHCLYNKNDLRWMDQLFYFPSTLTPDQAPIEAASYIVPKKFVDSLKSKNLDEVQINAFDYGVIILQRGLDESVSAIFSLAIDRLPSTTTDIPDIPDRPIPSPSDVLGRLPNPPKEDDDYRMIVGYSPGRLDRYNNESLADMIHATFCPIAPYWQKSNDQVPHFFYAYRCTSTVGMSGSPIFFKENDKYKVIGIHRGEAKRKNFNDGIHIDFEKSIRIQHWISQQVADPNKDVSTPLYNESDIDDAL